MKILEKNNKKLEIKTLFLLFLIIVLISLYISGCGMAPDGSKTVLIGADTYATGFYGSLFPYNFNRTEEVYNVDDIEFRRLDNDSFDLLHASIGPYSEGTIYCNESQYDEARAYYSDSDNYTYFCQIGTPKKDASPLVMDISHIDIEKFDSLIEFAEKNSYDPFDFVKNNKIEKLELPMPDETESPRLVFYKESKDGMFISSRGEYFHIIDDEIVLVFYYDYGYGEYEKLIAVKVPDEISDYIIDFWMELSTR